MRALFLLAALWALVASQGTPSAPASASLTGPISFGHGTHGSSSAVDVHGVTVARSTISPSGYTHTSRSGDAPAPGQKPGFLDIQFYTRMNFYTPSDHDASVILDAPFSNVKGMPLDDTFWQQYHANGDVAFSVTSEQTNAQLGPWLWTNLHQGPFELPFSLANFPPQEKAYTIHLWAANDVGTFLFQSRATLRVVSDEEARSLARHDRFEEPVYHRPQQTDSHVPPRAPISVSSSESSGVSDEEKDPDEWESGGVFDEEEDLDEWEHKLMNQVHKDLMAFEHKVQAFINDWLTNSKNKTAHGSPPLSKKQHQGIIEAHQPTGSEK